MIWDDANDFWSSMLGLAEMGHQTRALGVNLLEVRPHHREDGAPGFHPEAAVPRKPGFLGGEISNHRWRGRRRGVEGRVGAIEGQRCVGLPVRLHHRKSDRWRNGYRDKRRQKRDLGGGAGGG